MLRNGLGMSVKEDCNRSQAIMKREELLQQVRFRVVIAAGILGVICCSPSSAIAQESVSAEAKRFISDSVAGCGEFTEIVDGRFSGEPATRFRQERQSTVTFPGNSMKWVTKVSKWTDRPEHHEIRHHDVHVFTILVSLPDLSPVVDKKTTSKDLSIIEITCSSGACVRYESRWTRYVTTETGNRYNQILDYEPAKDTWYKFMLCTSKTGDRVANALKDLIGAYGGKPRKW
jgi:hypothetical protein